MADVHTKVQRSYNMSRIKSKNTTPEMLVRRFLHAKGFRYKLHESKLPGKPDIVLTKYKTIIFVHGCYWHGHSDCKDYVVPKTRTSWWLSKIGKNISRDLLATTALENDGWKVITLWGCQLEGKTKIKTLAQLPSLIRES
ncbi:MAG: DNA mismatch endonuclease Vsr [Chitinophagaceae bacterium]|nr:DNA mismatch endonuclease Vsr [Chitinophagaceae bacterium]